MTSERRSRRGAVSFTEPPWPHESELAQIIRNAQQQWEASRGSSEEVLELLPRRVVSTQASDAGECPICLEAYAPGEEVATMPCQGLHKGHWRCLERWLQSANSCPTCRWSLPETAWDMQHDPEIAERLGRPRDPIRPSRRVLRRQPVFILRGAGMGEAETRERTAPASVELSSADSGHPSVDARLQSLQRLGGLNASEVQVGRRRAREGRSQDQVAGQRTADSG